MAKKESEFQSRLIKDLKNEFAGCYVMKMDPTFNQGIPDLLILHNDKWATLECKRTSNSPKRPNQARHVERMNDMSYSAFIFPENKEVIMDELKQHFIKKEI